MKLKLKLSNESAVRFSVLVVTQMFIDDFMLTNTNMDVSADISSGSGFHPHIHNNSTKAKA